MTANKKLGCATCGIAEKDQHSLSEAARCDFLRFQSLTYESPKGAAVLELLKSGRKVDRNSL